MSGGPTSSVTPKVAMVSRRVHPAHGPGGLERHVYELLTHLAVRGVDIDLFSETPASPARRDTAEEAFSSAATVHWVPDRWLPIGDRRGTVVLDRITNYPLWSTRVAKAILTDGQTHGQLRWPILHVHGLAGWGLARSARPHGSRLVMTTHGLEEFRSHLRLKHWAYAPFRACMRTTARRSDVVVATDRALVPLVEHFLGIPASAQVVIPNAVDLRRCEQLGDRARGLGWLKRHGLSHASPVLLSVGRLEANKGFDRLVTALMRAGPTLPSGWVWVLVGDGPTRPDLERHVRETGLGSHIRLAGRLEDSDLHSLYAAADWFVHPTLYEGSSLATLEAMAHRLPVLASRTGGLPDKVEDGVTGLLVEPGDVDALAAAIQRAVARDGRALGAAGFQRCVSRFSWEAVAEQYLDLYRRLSPRA